MEKILEVDDLHISFNTYSGEVHAVRGVHFDVEKGETLAIVGESGSGKSVTAKAVMGLIEMPPGEVKQGAIKFADKDLTKLHEKEMQQIRGAEIAMIFQDPMTSLNPTITIGKQLTEGLRKHQGVGKSEARDRAIKLLNLVGIPNPETRVKQYPHQFSGGMRQRVVVAMGLACDPQLLIADEPTTALDVTIQAQILSLMKDLQKETGTSIVLITHDLGVVANMAQKVAVMYSGKIVETGTVDEIFYQPKHPYTWGLLSSVPNPDKRDHELFAIPGTPPDLLNPPKGCPFAPRCPHAMKICVEQMPEYTELTDTQKTACWLLDEGAPDVKPPVTLNVEE